MPRPSPFERARMYVQRSAPRAIQGSHGDNTTYSVACALVIEFALSDDEAWGLLQEYNRDKCLPPWSERDLWAKLKSARNMARSKPAEVGRLLNQDRADYSGPSGGSPTNPTAAKPASGTTKQKPSVPSVRAPTGPPMPRASTVRTPRTPLFNIYKAGAGAEPRPTRTLRTLLFHSSPNQVTKKPPVKEDGKKASGLSEPVREDRKPEPVPQPLPAPQESPEGEPVMDPADALPDAPAMPEASRQALRAVLGEDAQCRAARTINEFASEQAKKSDLPVTIFMKKTGRVVTVKPSGKRVLMGSLPVSDDPVSETGTP